MRVANGLGQGNRVAADHWVAPVERCVIETVVTHGKMDLLLLRSIADKVSKEVVCHLEALLSLHLCGHAKRHDQGDTEENDLFAHIFSN